MPLIRHGLDCNCCAPTAAAQSLDEVAFTRSAAAAAQAGDLFRVKSIIERSPAQLHGDGYQGTECSKEGVSEVGAAVLRSWAGIQQGQFWHEPPLLHHVGCLGYRLRSIWPGRDEAGGFKQSLWGLRVLEEGCVACRIKRLHPSALRRP